MTGEIFDRTAFHRGMRIRYKGREYEICAVAFDRRQVEFFNDNATPVWVKCEKIEIIK